MQKTGVCVMSTAAIDTHVLNSLFDNQQRLEDVFNSIFDDDSYFIGSDYSTAAGTASSADAPSRSCPSKPNRVSDSWQTFNKRYHRFYLLPVVLEIAAIYWIVAHFF